MELNRPPVLTVSESQHGEFEDRCKEMYEADYKMVSCNCGIVNSADYDFCAYLEAVFVDTKLDA